MAIEDLDPKASHSPMATYRFGLFTLDVTAGSLTHNGVRIKLQDQPFQLLVLLIEKGGATVSREEIRLRLWESNTFVDFDKSLGVAVVKVREALGDSAANPRFLETVPRRGYRFIAPVSVDVSEKPPESSPPPDVPQAALVPPQFPAASHLTPAVQDRKKTTPRFLWYAVTALGAALALAFAAFRIHSLPHPKPEPQHLSAQTRLRRSVAVLGFRNVTAGPDQNWLSTAFTEMLNTELGANGDLRLVSGEDVANVKHDLGLPAEDTLAKTTLARLKSSLGADVVVVGSYTLIGDAGKNRIRLDLRAQDTGLGETIFESSITGDEKDLFDLASQAGLQLREGLDPSLSLAPATASSNVEGSSNQLALQFYSEGLARLYVFDPVGARDLLKRAIAADAGFAAAHSALSSAYSSLGYEALERYEAKRALQYAGDLPEETALSIQGRYQESVNDWPKAILTYQKLFQRFPDNLKYGLQLAKVQFHSNQEEAERTLAILRALPAPLGDDPRIDLMEASVLVDRDLPRARAAAHRAIAKASALHSMLMVARGSGILCQTDSSFGTAADSFMADCNLARNSYLSAGDQNNAARTLNDFASLYFAQGDIAKAQTMWQEAIEVFRKFGDTEGLAASSNNLGDVLLSGGKLDEASKLLNQAIVGYRQIGDIAGVALALSDLGEITLQRANLPEARKNEEQALAAGLQAGDKSTTAYGIAGLGDVFFQQDELAAARKQYEQALRLRTEIGEKQSSLQTKVALARLAAEEGHAADAETQARECMSQLHQQQDPDDELDAGTVLVRALLDQSKISDAHRERDALRALADKTQVKAIHIRFAIESAGVLSAEHQEEAAVASLESVAKEAEASGLLALAWEARTVSATAQADAWHEASAEKLLEGMKARERKAGLLLLAHHADRAAKPANKP